MKKIEKEYQEYQEYADTNQNYEKVRADICKMGFTAMEADSIAFALHFGKKCLQYGMIHYAKEKLKVYNITDKETEKAFEQFLKDE